MDRIRFEGESPEEAEEFIATVRGIALKEGKHKDTEWIAFFASSCFVGPALRWLEDLDSEMLCDWNLLRRAILRKWPTEDNDDITSVIPAAAAAVAPTCEQLVSTHSQPRSLLKCTGCGGQRLPLDQDFCGQWCSNDAAESVPPPRIVENSTEEEAIERGMTEREESPNNTLPVMKGKQVRQTDLYLPRGQELEAEEDTLRGQEQPPPEADTGSSWGYDGFELSSYPPIGGYGRTEKTSTIRPMQWPTQETPRGRGGFGRRKRRGESASSKTIKPMTANEFWGLDD